ncbi:MAG: radical SAM family heme chaperone HemW [Pseudomonadota bacterium]|nr:radical SAM family heme chaperone HemW [Pseudomonadota bacterium]
MTDTPLMTEVPRLADWGSFGVYIHWPFCASKCPYCDFNSHVRERIDEPRFAAALCAEIVHFAAETQGHEVTSVFFGGGTPSLMTPETVALVLDRVRGTWTMADDVEITLEANPSSAEAARFKGYRQAGVNRLSLGVQSLDDDALKFLGRAHDAAQARAALTMAQAAFSRFSFDMIYARPDHAVADWLAELHEALDLGGDHLSLYQLTLEPGTPFHARAARGELVVPGGDDAAALYEATQEALAGVGLAAYEISNHARPGAESRHNLTYWRAGNYLGIGPGAHGRLTMDGTTTALRQRRAPEAWLGDVETKGHGTTERETVEPNARAAEVLMMGLRLAEGVPLARVKARSGLEFSEVVSEDRLAPLVDGGLLTTTDSHIRATAAGRRVLDSLLAALLA